MKQARIKYLVKIDDGYLDGIDFDLTTKSQARRFNTQEEILTVLNSNRYEDTDWEDKIITRSNIFDEIEDKNVSIETIVEID